MSIIQAPAANESQNQPSSIPLKRNDLHPGNGTGSLFHGVLCGVPTHLNDIVVDRVPRGYFSTDSSSHFSKRTRGRERRKLKSIFLPKRSQYSIRRWLPRPEAYAQPKHPRNMLESRHYKGDLIATSRAIYSGRRRLGTGSVGQAAGG